MTIISNDRGTRVPQQVLYRQAHRGLRVLGRHKDRDAALASFASVYEAVATEYVGEVDLLHRLQPVTGAELREGRQALDALRDQNAVWSAAVAPHVEDFDRSSYLDDDGMPDAVLTNARRLIDVMTDHKANAEQPLLFTDDLLATMGAALDAATKEWSEAQDALAARQERQARIRVLANKLQAHLVSLRQILRTVLGSAHRDYQKLRLVKAKILDEEDPEVEAGEGKPGDPVSGQGTVEPEGAPDGDEEAAAE